MSPAWRLAYEDFPPWLLYVGGRICRWALGMSGVAHQNGTCRFGDDPATPVLDRDYKAHEADNLYVADSSLFMSSTAVNPTLTIVANALRVAERIAERLRTRTSVAPLVSQSR